MQHPSYKSALIVGTGPGLSASLTRLLRSHGLAVAVAARRTDTLAGLCAETGAVAHACDATDEAAVAALFQRVDGDQGAPDVVIYNPSARAPGPLVDLDPQAVRRAIDITAFGAFLVAQQAARRMVKAGHGAILLSGATAGVKGFPKSAAFAMGKFALRGLAQSMARELAPQGVHVAHIVIDGGIRSATRPVPPDAPDSFLHPDAIAENYWHLMQQPRSAWSWELEVRPWVERF